MSRRVLYDTNVLLDVILLRAPHVGASAAALDLAGTGVVEGFVAGHAVTTIAYLIQREKSLATAKKALVQLLSRVRVAPTTDSAVRLALAMGLGDFEDAVTVASAQEAGCDLIVTRNIRHFRSALVKAVLPEALAASGPGSTGSRQSPSAGSSASVAALDASCADSADSSRRRPSSHDCRAAARSPSMARRRSSSAASRARASCRYEVLLGHETGPPALLLKGKHLRGA